MKKILLFLSMLILSASLFAVEITTTEEGKAEVVEESGTWNEDYMFFGDTLEFSGYAKDLYFMGNRFDFTGASDGLLAFGQTIKIDGNVNDSIHLIGGTVIVNGDIEGSVFAAGKAVNIESGTVINGALISGASDLNITGTVNGDVYAGSGYLFIDGTVNGNVTANAGKIIISDRGRINGNLVYGSESEITASEAARVSGTIERRDYEKSCPAKDRAESKAGFHIFKAIFFIPALIIGGLLILLFPGTRKLQEERTGQRFWKTLLWGLIPFFLYPIAVLVFIPLFPVSIALGLAALPVLSLAQIFGLTITGQYLFRLFKWKKDNRFLYFLLAAGFYFVAALLPFINLLAMIFISAVGWGFMIEILFSKRLE